MASRLGGPGALVGGGGGTLTPRLEVFGLCVRVETTGLAVCESTCILTGPSMRVEALALFGEEDRLRVEASLSLDETDWSRAALALSCDKAADLLRVMMVSLPRGVGLLEGGLAEARTSAKHFGLAWAGVSRGLTKQVLVSLFTLGVLKA
jgi:hypothetical protein